MNICVYGASSNILAEEYIKSGELMGETIAKHNANVVFGGGAAGLMGAVARGAKRCGAKVTGIVPSFFNVDGILYDNCDEMIYTETMSERKALLLEKADAILVTPGGIGTFDEFFETITLRQLSVHSKPIAIYNANGYFNSLIALLDNAINEKFMTEKNRDLYFISDNPEDIMEYYKNYDPKATTIYDFKKFKD